MLSEVKVAIAYIKKYIKPSYVPSWQNTPTTSKEKTTVPKNVKSISISKITPLLNRMRLRSSYRGKEKKRSSSKDTTQDTARPQKKVSHLLKPSCRRPSPKKTLSLK